LRNQRRGQVGSLEGAGKVREGGGVRWEKRMRTEKNKRMRVTTVSGRGGKNTCEFTSKKNHRIKEGHRKSRKGSLVRALGMTFLPAVALMRLRNGKREMGNPSMERKRVTKVAQLTGEGKKAGSRRKRLEKRRYKGSLGGPPWRVLQRPEQTNRLKETAWEGIRRWPC